MINLERDIQSLSTFKRNTNDLIGQMKETGSPIVLTVNGKAELVVQDAAAYQRLIDWIERLESLLAIQRGLTDVKNGDTKSLESFITEMQDKHGISG